MSEARMYFKYHAHGGVTKDKIVSETRYSYITESGWKYKKNQVLVITEQEYEEHQWAVNRRYAISQMVQDPRRVTGAMVKLIAELIGYEVQE